MKTGGPLRDRDPLPGLPAASWEQVRGQVSGASDGQIRRVHRLANETLAVFRALSKGCLGEGGAPAAPTPWPSSSEAQRFVVHDVIARWSSWLPSLEAAPSVPDACQRLLGTPQSAYGGMMGDSPIGNLKDAQNRPILPKGAVCGIDVEELSLPLAGSELIKITEVSPEAAAYLEHFE